MSLRQLLDQVYQHAGIAHKRDISVLTPYMPVVPAGLHPNGCLLYTSDAADE